MILIDANVVLELLIEGRKNKNKAIDFLTTNDQNFCISMLTVHLVLYFGAKDSLNTVELKNFLSDYPKISLLAEDYEKAMDLIKNDDHEDALQLACALRSRCKSIATFDKNFAKTYKNEINFILL